MNGEEEKSSSPPLQDPAFLSTVEGEIALFRSIMRARPVGIHRHFHILSVQSSIFKDTGQLVCIEDIWTKLQSCYEFDALEGLVSTFLPRWHRDVFIVILPPFLFGFG